MLRLAQKVGGAKLRIYGFVRDHHCLGRSCEQIDADAAEKLTFGFGDESIAGADEHVGGFDGFGAQRHRADGLNAAEAVNLVRAAKVHCCDDGGVRAPIDGRRGGHDAGNASDRGGQDRHVGSRHHREFAARDIAADRLHRDVAVAEDHARFRLHLDIGH